MENSRAYIGFDIGGTNYKAGTLRFSPDSTLVESFEPAIPTHKLEKIEYLPSKADDGFATSYPNLLHFIAKYIRNDKPEVIGIGFPSVVVDGTRIPVAPNMKGWVDIDLKTRLTSDLSYLLGYDCEILIENDANVAALAELELGSGLALDSFIYVTLGTGIGGSIVYNRSLMKGTSFSAGEVGHIIIDRNDSKSANSGAIKATLNERYRMGVLESYASKKIILDTYNSLQKNRIRRTGEVKEIFDRARKNDSLAIQTINVYIENLSIGIASAINLLGIPKIILGGGISNSIKDIHIELESRIRERLLPSNVSLFEIMYAHYQQNAGLIGSALMAKQYEDNRIK